MAYDVKNLEEGTGFEYPPVSDVYANPHSSFWPMNTYSGQDAFGGVEVCEPEPSLYPYYEHHATASTTPPYHFSYPDDGFRVPALEQITSVTSPTSLAEHGLPMFPVYTDPTPSPAGATKPRFISYRTRATRTKRPRGTTGSVVCDRCGNKFTVISSLNRHSKICRGKRPAKDPRPTQRKSIKIKNVGSKSDYNTDGLPIVESRPTPQDGFEHNLNVHEVLAADIIVDSLGSGNASLMSDSTTPEPYPLSPVSTQSYIPQGADTSADHVTFFCDLCPGEFARRDLLQLHKARVHSLTEIPYLPDSDNIDTPPYLTGMTPENSKIKNSRAALQIFEGGALSSSPCQPCESKGLDCIVNPVVSSKCAYCAHWSNGVCCGAAGVKYSKPRGTGDDQVFRANE